MSLLSDSKEKESTSNNHNSNYKKVSGDKAKVSFDDLRKNKLSKINLERSVIITSALPYANGEIHLGHIASTYLPADIFTRFLKLIGANAYHICATDDYGTRPQDSHRSEY